MRGQKKSSLGALTVDVETVKLASTLRASRDIRVKIGKLFSRTANASCASVDSGPRVSPRRQGDTLALCGQTRQLQEPITWISVWNALIVDVACVQCGISRAKGKGASRFEGTRAAVVSEPCQLESHEGFRECAVCVGDGLPERGSASSRERGEGEAHETGDWTGQEATCSINHQA